jgi:hypothetical protein
MAKSFPRKEPYLSALKETDQKRLTDLTYAADEAVFFRFGEIEGLRITTKNEMK